MDEICIVVVGWYVVFLFGHLQCVPTGLSAGWQLSGPVHVQFAVRPMAEEPCCATVMEWQHMQTKRDQSVDCRQLAESTCWWPSLSSPHIYRYAAVRLVAVRLFTSPLLVHFSGMGLSRERKKYALLILLCVWGGRGGEKVSCKKGILSHMSIAEPHVSSDVDFKNHLRMTHILWFCSICWSLTLKS